MIEDKQMSALLERSEIFEKGISYKSLAALSAQVAEQDAKVRAKRKRWFLYKKTEEATFVLFGSSPA